MVKITKGEQMIVSMFKKPYVFLEDCFVLNIARKTHLQYQPKFPNFYSEYYEFFTITMNYIPEEKIFKLNFVVDNHSKVKTFTEEEEMILYIKKELIKRKKIGNIKKMFNV